MTDDFDWDGEDGAEDRVIPHQPETGVYKNLKGAVVIRQRSTGDNEDPHVTVQPEYLAALIAKLSTFLPQK